MRGVMDPRPEAINLSGMGESVRGQDSPDGVSDAVPPDLPALARQMQVLEHRVHALEERLEGTPRFVQASSRSTPTPVQPSRDGTAKAAPALGEALLAIAGAYLLRALAEYKVVPLTVGAVAGILYALVWLILAARVAPKKRVVGTIRGVTSALILVPLLWEATVQFGALSSWTAAGVVIVYSCLGLAVSWRGSLRITAWTTTLASLLAVVALLIATHELVPFTLALLVMAAVVEGSACLGHALPERWLVAMIADVAVLFLASIVVREGGVPEGYVPISTAMALTVQIALLVIYLSSTSVRALGCAILTGFETTQIILALVLSATGVLRITHGGAAAVDLVSAFSLLCGVLFYGFSFAFGRSTARGSRNLYTYSTLGLLLVLAGTVMQFSGALLALVLSLFALLTLFIARWANQASLRWHAAAYLLLATMLSGLAAWATAHLLGTGYGWTPPPMAARITATTTILAYLLVWKSAKAWSSFSAQTVPVLVIVASASWALAGLAAGALSGLCGGALAGSLCGALRTFVLTLMAILLAFSGMTWKRRELLWLLYPFMALAGYKLLVQDLPRGQTLSLFASLFLYGGALILLPRILQKSRVPF